MHSSFFHSLCRSLSFFDCVYHSLFNCLTYLLLFLLFIIYLMMYVFHVLLIDI